MIKKLAPADLYQSLIDNDVRYFCGVPDSLLSSFGFYLVDHANEAHDVAVNEGSAVALAIGYYLATAKVPLVYMQNSGLGNATNPLISLADQLVMGIPMILLIGWRGQPGIKDEPQHAKQGQATTSLLASLGIAYDVLASETSLAATQIHDAVGATLQSNQPVALLVQSNTLETYRAARPTTSDYSLSREETVQMIADNLTSQDVIVATTGKTGRELFAYREVRQHSHDQDLLTVGGMGHASTIACGIAQQQPTRQIYILDGDGAVLMHMGALAFIGNSRLKNVYHFVINNGAHESVGGQLTIAHDINLPAIAKACGYSQVYVVSECQELREVLHTIKNLPGPVFIEINTSSTSRPDLTRPTIQPSDNKAAFMDFLNRDD